MCSGEETKHHLYVSTYFTEHFFMVTFIKISEIFFFRLTDDQGYADVGFTNPDTPFVTPNIDNLAQNSIK